MSEIEATELAPHLAVGRLGEEMAAQYLATRGYRLAAANFIVPVGRNLRGALVHAELDLVAYEDSMLCFIEVKTRVSDWFAPPEANVDLRKQRQISRAARAYRRLFELTGTPSRFDVISVTLSPSATTHTPSAEMPHAPTSPRIELFKNFWTDDKFRKRRWTDTHFDY